METVGIFLKKEREAHNISLGEIAQKTKITPFYLELIEKNEFDKIPQGPYIKGYLSSYSQAVGCDVDKIINLYRSANREQAPAEVVQPEPASIDTGKQSADEPKKIGPKPSSRLRMGEPSSWFNSLVSSAVTRGASMKAALKAIGTTTSSKTQNGNPARHRAGRENPYRFSIITKRPLSGPRTWMYACIALFGIFLLFLAGVGFYHLFLYTPESPPVVEAEMARDKEEPLLSAVDPQPPALPSSSTNAPTDTPNDRVARSLLTGPVGFDATVSSAESETDSSSGFAGSAESNGSPASGNAFTAQQTPLPRESTFVNSEGASSKQSVKNDPPPKPTIADASLKVLKAAICRAIENRMPAGVDQSFPTSDGKIYVWTQIEAREIPSKIHHIYYFDGKKFGDVALDVRSSNWRTWSSRTIADARYRGKWRVDIATSEGEVLRRLYYEVK